MATLYGSWDEGGPYKVERLLMFEPYHDYGPWEVQTIAGVARAPLERACGFADGLRSTDTSPDVVSLGIPVSDADRYETSRTGRWCIVFFRKTFGLRRPRRLRL